MVMHASLTACTLIRTPQTTGVFLLTYGLAFAAAVWAVVAALTATNSGHLSTTAAGQTWAERNDVVPSHETILNGLTAIADDWRWLAISWHVFLAVLLVTLFAGRRPSIRVLGYLLVAPLVSVSVVAWLSSNPFNGCGFGVLAITLIWTATRFSNRSIRPASPAWVVGAVALISFGWTYPHFLRTDSWTTYLYAAPFGLLPCPTLSVVIGMTLLIQSLRSTLWCAALVIAGVLYGTVGVFGLDVALDWGLVVGSILLAGAAAHHNRSRRSVRADFSEQARVLERAGHPQQRADRVET